MEDTRGQRAEHLKRASEVGEGNGQAVDRVDHVADALRETCGLQRGVQPDPAHGGERVAEVVEHQERVLLHGVRLHGHDAGLRAHRHHVLNEAPLR
eukprot:9244653-Pyramimonas_sp.AAC.1